MRVVCTIVFTSHEWLRARFGRTPEAAIGPDSPSGSTRQVGKLKAPRKCSLHKANPPSCVAFLFRGSKISVNTSRESESCQAPRSWRSTGTGSRAKGRGGLCSACEVTVLSLVISGLVVPRMDLEGTGGRRFRFRCVPRFGDAGFISFIPVRRFPAADVWNWRGGVQVGVPRFQDLAVRFQVFHLGGGGGRWGGGAVIAVGVWACTGALYNAAIQGRTAIQGCGGENAWGRWGARSVRAVGMELEEGGRGGSGSGSGSEAPRFGDAASVFEVPRFQGSGLEGKGGRLGFRFGLGGFKIWRCGFDLFHSGDEGGGGSEVRDWRGSGGGLV